MSIDELTAYFVERGFELHGRVLGRSGACHLVASLRDTWDHGDKECRVFHAANTRDADADFIRYKFSVSRSALASDRVRRLTGDPEEFLLQAGLLRFRRFLLEDDSAGRSEEVMLHSRSESDEFLMHDPLELRSEVARVKRAVLELLWEDRHRGIKSTEKRRVEDHVCAASSLLDSVLDSFEQHKFVATVDGASRMTITAGGEAELDRLQFGPGPGKPSPIVNAARPIAMQGDHYDVFISHASEDKDALVRPLAEALKNRAVKVWYDEFALDWGASLRESIDRGLVKSRYGLVVLSHSFFAKDWPQRELNALFATMQGGERRILPIWHGLSANEVQKYSPLLSDLLAVNSSEGVAAIVERVLSVCQERH